MRIKTLRVFLGRFCPIHKGHQKLIDILLKKYGSSNCLIIVGSSNSLNQRTPFTFKARKRMINILYPNLKIVGFPDTRPQTEVFAKSGVSTWLKRLKNLECKLNTKFIFYSGNSKDISYLKGIFRIKILIERDKDGSGISGTKVRRSLVAKNQKLLNEYLDPKIINLVIEEFEKFPKTST